MSGVCYLVGAGPGDLGLVTLRARECVERADVIVYDYLCNPLILEWAPAAAEKIYVGKKAGAHTLSQEEINRLLVDRTREGKNVVRLKGGDPFVFGRGGEEALELAGAQLRFEVVPGVSSALAGPAYAGIPVTHRDIASQFTVFTAHEDPSKPESAVDYRAIAQGPGTRVMLMGVERLHKITERLLGEGANPELPVALIRWATTGQHNTLVGKLHNIAALAEELNFLPPAVAVFGEVVKLRQQLNWFEQRPLFGKRIAVTRTRQQAGALSSSLAQLGADVYEIPTIRTEQPPDLMGFGQCVMDSHAYDWIVFTSPNGVNAFFEMFFKLYDDMRSIGGARIAAIGPATAQRIRDFHLKVDAQPEEAVAEKLVATLEEAGSVENLKIMWVRPESARDAVTSHLEAAGAIVDHAVAYRTVPETGDPTGGVHRFRESGADLVTFTSSSTVENFMALGLPVSPELRFASIGPITSKTMRDLGLRIDVEAKQHDIPGLVQAIRGYFGAGIR